MSRVALKTKPRHPILRTVLRAGAALCVAAPLTTLAAGIGHINIWKLGGDVDVNEAPEGATVVTMGGNIHLHQVRGAAFLKTMGGNIEVDAADGSVNAQTMAGDVSVHLDAEAIGKSNQTVRLSSNGGQITLFVPHDFGAKIDLSLATTENNSNSYRIVDNFGLAQNASGDWDKTHGTPRKYQRASGRIGDGKNQIVIETINGNIILKPEPKTI